MMFGVGHVGKQSVVGRRGVQGASLDLGFTSPGTLDPRITFTRASTATYFDSVGTLQTATTNTPRWDYDPVTHALLGLLIEETRTNVLLNTATLGTQSVAVTAQSYVLSFYGTGTVTKSGTASGALVGTGATQRVSQVFTPTAGTLTLTVTGTVTNAQLEAGGFVTSYIASVGTAGTRAADNAALPTAAWFSASVGSIATEFIMRTLPTTQNTEFVAVGTNSGVLIRAMVGGASSVPTVQVFNGGGALLNATSVNLASVGTTQKHSFTYNGSSLVTAASLNGGAVVSGTASGAYGGFTTLFLGGSAGGRGFPLNSTISRVRYWPRALTNAELQSVTV